MSKDRTIEANAQNSEQKPSSSSARIEKIIRDTDPAKEDPNIQPEARSSGRNEFFRPSERESSVLDQTEKEARRTDPEHRES